MNWTIDHYAIGRKGTYRIVFRGLNEHVQLLRPGAGYLEDILHFVKPAGGKYPAVEAYDAPPKGWETVEGGARKVAP